ncbi:cytochrome P450 [Mycobacterium intracellulare subsp. chimaera]|uniref:Cytochrome P450 n=5 Tax=Mycobacteriaceae TaxID=1762 RepID=A0A1Y0T0W1_MYCIT|nr:MULTISPECIES: cytochrome P450 [Mycobacterium]ARV80765.1 cytochrome P450 [Mycobacterium intracellulare subsp. chimaera]ASL07721.1 cytochrome P450 [Mycobacterium intracellulare subsp. chimaera]ASL13375.1 cytochrome P450 [Mycobacterium intracellulare subsp. chimaera]ASL19510.1 cytochrome P450 [Mycobacterium intracellulare subsp. chimaera]MCV7328277.1 cytochrome P450 [Mycobacterium intracellulare subsp. chimaera]
MVNPLHAPVDKARERLSSVILIPAPQRVDDGLRRWSRRWPVRELAAPPAGSGLRPVLGDAGLPLVGHTLDYIRFGSDLGRERYERFGSVSWMGAFGTKMAVIAGPQATQEALTTNAKAFSQDGWAFLIDAFFHRGLMLMSFDEHLMHRRIMQEAFTRPRLAGYVTQVTPCVRATLPTWPTGPSVRMYPLLKNLTLDIATDVFMGGRGKDSSDAINQAFVATVRAASSLVRAPLPGTRYRAGIRGRRVLEEYFARHLPAARAGNSNDLFAALCHASTEDGQRFSDSDVINHMIFLMMAAHDTSTITTTAVTYYLAKHPEWQDRVRAESDALGDRSPEIDDLEALRSLDLVIKESMRLVAPVPLVMRKTVQDTAIDGHYIPRDTLVAITPAVNHFVREVWHDPDRFDPLRFDDPRREDQAHRFAWLPFGGGAHKCIGMHFGTLEVKAILHQMLRTFTFGLDTDYRIRWDNTSLPIPVDGLPITLRRR